MNYRATFNTLHSLQIAQDRPFISAKSAFIRAKKLEAQYGARLRQIARHVGDIVTGFDWNTFASSTFAQAALRRYADLLHPWAAAVGERMVTEVAAADKNEWRKISADMGRALHKEIETAPTGQVMRESMERQVTLITSLPIEAAERVHKLTIEAMTTGRRADEIADEIMRTGAATRSRADTIARTEVSRTSTELTKARAEHVGSTHFIWQTAKDADVRHDHKILAGKVFRWDDPPIADQRTGATALPGGIYNCRCWPRPVIAD